MFLKTDLLWTEVANPVVLSSSDLIDVESLVSDDNDFTTFAIQHEKAEI